MSDDFLELCHFYIVLPLKTRLANYFFGKKKHVMFLNDVSFLFKNIKISFLRKTRVLNMIFLLTKPYLNNNVSLYICTS